LPTFCQDRDTTPSSDTATPSVLGPPRHRSLKLQWTFVGGYDDDVVAENGGGSNTQPQVGGTWQSAEASFRYAVEQRHLTVAVNAFGAGRYYPQLQILNAIDGGGHAAVNADLGRRTKVFASQGALIRPYYQFNFLTPAPLTRSSSPEPLSAPDDALTREDWRSIDGTVGLSQRMGSRSSMDFGYTYRRTTLGTGGGSFQATFANALFTQRLARFAGLRIGYGHGQSEDGLRLTSRRIAVENLDIGIDYSRPLSTSHRTTIGFRSGSNLVTQDGRHEYRFLGEASIARRLTRTWIADFQFGRTVSFVELFGATYPTTAQARISGRAARHLTIDLSSSYAIGQAGLFRTGAYTAWSQNAELRIELNRRVALTARYGLYQYGFDAAVPVPFGLPHNVHRQSIRFGLTGGVPRLR
jgi:hypothetical protein